MASTKSDTEASPSTPPSAITVLTFLIQYSKSVTEFNLTVWVVTALTYVHAFATVFTWF